jgi:hypothetical protein
VPRFPLVAMASILLTSATCVQTHAKEPATTQSASITEQRTNSTPDSSGAVRQFVQEFYNRYQDKTFFRMDWRDLDQFVDADLMRALRGDSAAAAQPRDTRQMLSFDPFLATSGTCPRYDVVDVRRDGQTYKVAMLPVCGDPRWQPQRPVVEVVREGNRWMIANVWYHYDPNGPSDLKGLLCAWAKADLIPERRPADCGRGR